MSELALTMAEKVERLEEVMLQLPQADCPVVHRFGPGIYIREVTLPAGIFAIGHYQKTQHLNVMIKGRVLVVNDDGSRSLLVAPLTFIGEPGRKVGYVLEDVLWQNIYATDETDIDILEEAYLDKSDTFLLHEAQRIEAENISNEVNRIDFKVAISELGYDEETVREQSENRDDQVNMPEGVHPYRIAESNIEGLGYYLTSPADNGTILAPAKIKGLRTPAGRYVNHSMTPNAKMVHSEDGNIYLMAIKPINGAQGGNIGDEVTVDYRESVKLVRGGPCQV